MPQKLYKALAKMDSAATNRPGSGRGAYGFNPRKKGKVIKLEVHGK